MSTLKTNKEEIIHKILASKSFSKSRTLCDLLNYLYQAHNNNLDVKAVNIAIDLLQRKGEIDENDETIARVYIHKLRTKLNAYYANEGKNDTVILEIPKGKYVLEFIEKNKEEPANARKNSFQPMIISIITLLPINFILLWIFGIFSGNSANTIWKEFVKEKEPVNLILANPFFYTAHNDKTTFVVRNFDINSQEDLKTNSSAFPDENFKLASSDLSYFSNNNITSLPMLFSVIAKSDSEIKLYSSLDFNLERVIDNNSIAITSHKSIGFFKQFLSQTSFEISDDCVLYLNKKNEKLKYLTPKISNDYYDDYALFIKIPTPKGKTLCLLSDYHSIGNKGLMELITNKDAEELILDHSESDLSKIPDYFELLVKVSGYQEENLKTEIIHFKALSE